MKISKFYFLQLSAILIILSCTPDPVETCTDQILNGTETGIDCGGSDCPPCISCSDGVQNGSETAVDCGGDCPPCEILGCTSSDAHNYNSLANTDDGSCLTCTDGIMNGDETDIDCGGVLCEACQILGCTDQNAHNYNPLANTDDGSCETCSDGVLNGDEDEIDCGGTLCTPCYLIGEPGPGTGVVFYDKGSYSNGWRYLEVGPDIQGTNETWGCDNQFISSTSLAIGSGFENSQQIIQYHLATPCVKEPVAVIQTLAYSNGGFSDWFLPSVNELKEMFPIKSQLGLTSGRYWSSTESNAEDAYVVDFGASSADDSSYTYYKIPTGGQQGNARIKPVRRF